MANAPPLPPNGKAAGVVARSQQPRPKQQPSFEVCKKNALGKLDKSPKGSLDQPIAELVHAMVPFEETAEERYFYFHVRALVLGLVL